MLSGHHVLIKCFTPVSQIDAVFSLWLKTLSCSRRSYEGSLGTVHTCISCSPSIFTWYNGPKKEPHATLKQQFPTYSSFLNDWVNCSPVEHIILVYTLWKKTQENENWFTWAFFSAYLFLFTNKVTGMWFGNLTSSLWKNGYSVFLHKGKKSLEHLKQFFETFPSTVLSCSHLSLVHWGKYWNWIFVCKKAHTAFTTE